MKNLTISVLVTLFASIAFADTSIIDVRGRGSYSNLCQGGSFGWSCIDRTKQQAESSASRDAEFQCYARQGRVLGAFGYCNAWCFPNSLPDDNQFHHVNCSADCTVRCEIEI